MTSTSVRQGGFSLLEALTALKQRTEATRLAQEKLEQLRAYQQVAGDGAGNKFDYTDDVISGSDVVDPQNSSYVTNASYTRTWTVTGSGTDPQKWIRVAVDWTDRNGSAQNVTLRSVIARADIASIGTIAVGPGTTKVRTPKNRSIDIPYPAVSLGGGMSGFMPPGGSQFFIFSNVTGDVIGVCNSALAEGTTVTFSGDCSEYGVKRLLLSGYIRFVGGNFNLSDLVNPTDPTKPLTVDLDLNVGGGAACFAERQKVVSAGNISAPRNIASAGRTGNVVTVTTSGNHGFSAGQFVSINGASNTTFNGVFVLSTASGNTFTYAQIGGDASFSGGTPAATAVLVQEVIINESATAPPGYNSVISTFIAYTCIVLPADHDSDPNTPNRWTGKLRFTPNGWTIGSAAGTSRVCRFTGDYVADGSVSNSENPLYHLGVTGALDHQNFVVIDGNRSCPSDSAANPTTGKYTNLNTTVHQTDGSGGGGARSGTNSGGANGNGGFTTAEPNDVTATLPMF